MNMDAQRGSSLKVNCPQASRMRLTNLNDQCLQVGLPRAARMEIVGNKTVSVILPPLSLPTVIDVSGTTHWGAPGRNPSNTRVMERLSQLQAHGDALLGGSLRIEGKLQYAVPDGAFGVVVEGCGLARGVTCVVRDSNGRLVCRLSNMCISNASAAEQTMLFQLNSMPPCTKPD